MTLTARPEWHVEAACTRPDVNPEWFWPERGQTDKIIFAKSVCDVCDVARECLSYGLKEKFGIWGGKTVRERSIILGRRRA